MAADTKTYIDGKLPVLESKTSNGWKNENNNLIESAGIILDTGNNLQTTQAITNYANAAKTFQDNGIQEENIYQLSSLNNFESPTHYENGLNLYFFPSFSNEEGPFLSLNGLEIKPIVDLNGLSLEVDQIFAEKLTFLVFDSIADAFVFIPNTSDQVYGSFQNTIAHTSAGSSDVLISFDKFIGSKGVNYNISNSSFSIQNSGDYLIEATFALEGNTENGPQIKFTRDNIEIDSLFTETPGIASPLSLQYSVLTRNSDLNVNYQFAFFNDKELASNYSFKIFRSWRMSILNLRISQLKVTLLGE